MRLSLLLFGLMFIFGQAPEAQTLLKDIEDLGDFGNPGSNPTNWSAVNDELFIFEAARLSDTSYMFASDGTEAGTIPLGTTSAESDIIRFGDHAYFGGCDLFQGAASCFELYRSDGTPEGTGLFLDVGPGVFPGNVNNLVAGDTLFFFSAQTAETGTELWRSNGTVEGTFSVGDIAPGFESGFVGQLNVIDDIAYFAGFTPEAGTEAWRSDGTPEGTYMIVDLNEGTASGHAAEFTASGGFVYFTGLGTNSGFELRRTNGQPGNVETFGEFSGSTDGSVPGGFVDSDGRLYYVAQGDGDAAGFDLHVFDHVGEPLHLDLGSNIFPRALMPFGDGEVIFNAADEGGRELWRSDGTIAGTRRIIDLHPGDSSGVFGTGSVGGSYFVYGDSLVYFAGKDGVNAQGEFVFELFVTDGTAEGTQLVSDQDPGPGGTNPGSFFEFDERVYFAATDPEVGREPFYLGPGQVSRTVEPIDGLSTIRPPYPNPLPTGGSLNLAIDLKRTTRLAAQLYDAAGRPVRSWENLGTFPAGEQQVQIPTIDLPTGFYHLVLSDGQGQEAFRVMIE